MQGQGLEKISHEYLHPYRWFNYLNANDEINALSLTEYGTLYVATKGKLFHYNLQNWAKYNLPPSQQFSKIQTIEAKNDTAVIATSSGVLFFYNETFHEYDEKNRPFRKNIILAINKDRTAITEAGDIYRLSGQYWERISHPSRKLKFKKVLAYKKSFIGLSEGRLYLHANNNWKEISNSDNEKITAFTLNQKSIYYTTETGNFYKYNRGNPNKIYRLKQKLAISEIAYSNESFYFLTDKGLYRLHKQQNFHISDKQVSKIAISNSPRKAVWLASKELYKYIPGQWKSIKKKHFTEQVLGFYHYKEFLISCSQNEGIYLFNEHFLNSKTISTERIISSDIDDKNGILFCSTGKSLLQYDLNSEKMTRIKSAEFIKSIMFINDTLYLSGSGNVYTLDNKELKLYYKSHTVINNIFFDSKRKWLQANDTLYHLNKNKIKARISTKYLAITDLLEINEQLIIATENDGLYRYKSTGLKKLDISPTERIYKILRHDSNLFITSNSGLYFTSVLLKEPFVQYNHENGLSATNLKYPVLKVDRKKRLWVSGSRGLNYNYISSIKEKKSHLNYKILENNSQNFKIQFFSNSDLRESENLFRSRLLPAEEKFSNWSKRSLFEFIQLKPGDYELQVEGLDYSKNSSWPLIFRFTVSSPWYLNNYAVIVYILILFLTIYFLFRLFMNQLKKRNRILEEKVNERTKIIEEQKKELEKTHHQLEENYQVLSHVNNQKSEVLGIVAHDLKNPLTSIIGYTEIIASDDMDEERKSYVNIVLESAFKMNDLINHLLDQEFLESGEIPFKLEPVDFKELISNVLKSYQLHLTKKEIIVEEVYAGQMLTLADRERMREILDNLISNAIKYTFLKSKIYIVISNETIQSISYMKIAIKDEGPGLTDKDLKLLFGRFQRLSAKPTAGESSTGLGLSIVKKLVELHEGDVWAESIYGEGATFFLRLQLKD